MPDSPKDAMWHTKEGPPLPVSKMGDAHLRNAYKAVAAGRGFSHLEDLLSFQTKWLPVLKAEIRRRKAIGQPYLCSAHQRTLDYIRAQGEFNWRKCNSFRDKNGNTVRIGPRHIDFLLEHGYIIDCNGDRDRADGWWYKAVAWRTCEDGVARQVPGFEDVPLVEE